MRGVDLQRGSSGRQRDLRSLRRPVRRAYVFGSVAAGTADEHSDMDVIVVRHTTQPFFDRMREIMELRPGVWSRGHVDLFPAELEQMLAEDGRYFVKQAVAQDTELREPSREADRWLRQAENDLAYATVGLREGFAAQVCFQCQQVCEKAIKALRYARANCGSWSRSRRAIRAAGGDGPVPR